MKRSLRISYWIALLLVLLTAGCSAPPENSNATGNDNAAASNANAPSLTAQPATTPATSAPATSAPTAVSPAPAVQPAPAAKPAETATKPAPAEATPRVEGPKLVLVSQEKELDFGKQPQ